jgi:hypothetical protein
MKSIPFTGENAIESYEILYDGMVNTQQPLSLSETRVVGKILDKLEAMGATAERAGNKTFTLAGPGRLVLEDTEYKLMKECLEAVRWNARASRQVGRAMDLFEQATDDTAG